MAHDDKHTDAFWAKVDSVVALILENDRYLNNRRNPELIEIVRQKWGVEVRMAQEYVSHAKTEIRKIGRRNKEKAFTRAMRDREFLFQRAKGGVKNKDGKFEVFPDYDLALKVIKDRDEINGLYETNVNVKGELKNTLNFDGISTNDLLTLIDELKKLNTTES